MNETESKSQKLVADRIWVGFTQYDPCLLWKNGAERKCGKSDLTYTIRCDSGCMLALMAINNTLPDRIQHVYWAGSIMAKYLTKTDQVICGSKEGSSILVGDDRMSHLHNQVSMTENIA